MTMRMLTNQLQIGWLRLVIASVVIAGASKTVLGQATSKGDDNLGLAIQQARAGDFSHGAAKIIARAHVLWADQILKDQFVHLDDTKDKALIAVALVEMKNSAPEYWNYLVAYVRIAIERDAPFPLTFDASGKTVLDKVSPAFLQWVSALKSDRDDAATMLLFDDPGRILLFASTGDSRAIPLLRLGLKSTNYMVEVAASEGLAKVQDLAAIPLISDACKKAPADVAHAIAISLIYFHTPEAQRIAAMYLPPAEIDAYRKSSFTDPF